MNGKTSSRSTSVKSTEPRLRLPAQADPIDRRRLRASALGGYAGVEASQLVADPEEELLAATMLPGGAGVV